VASVLAGGIIGLVAGMTGIGGGIFIAPLVLTFGWLGMRQTAGLSAFFNLLNSAAAFAGLWSTSSAFPRELPVVVGRSCRGRHIRCKAWHKASGATSVALSPSSTFVDRRIVDAVGCIKSGPVAFR